MMKDTTICDSCIFFNAEEGNCPAFPDGIPLTPEDTHFKPIEGQAGDTVYQRSENRLQHWDLWREMYPEVRVPSELER